MAGGLHAGASWAPTGSEIEGPADTDTALLKRIGCTVEIVSWRARAFAAGPEVLDRVLERWPLAA